MKDVYKLKSYGRGECRRTTNTIELIADNRTHQYSGFGMMAERMVKNREGRCAAKSQHALIVW